MKKVLVFLVFIMAVMVVNAQTTTAVDSTRTTVNVVDLQKAITDNIAKDYVGYTIREATAVTVKTIVTYEVVIVKGDATETLVYDKDGVFVKKCVPTPLK
jgi:hypothetical protein